ncbi:hypothetical protein EV1_041561 [Malus domestica]
MINYFSTYYMGLVQDFEINKLRKAKSSTTKLFGMGRVGKKSISDFQKICRQLSDYDTAKLVSSCLIMTLLRLVSTTSLLRLVSTTSLSTRLPKLASTTSLASLPSSPSTASTSTLSISRLSTTS